MRKCVQRWPRNGVQNRDRYIKKTGISVTRPYNCGRTRPLIQKQGGLFRESPEHNHSIFTLPHAITFPHIPANPHRFSYPLSHIVEVWPQFPDHLPYMRQYGEYSDIGVSPGDFKYLSPPLYPSIAAPSPNFELSNSSRSSVKQGSLILFGRYECRGASSWNGVRNLHRWVWKPELSPRWWIRVVFILDSNRFQLFAVRFQKWAITVHPPADDSRGTDNCSVSPWSGSAL